MTIVTREGSGAQNGDGTAARTSPSEPVGGENVIDWLIAWDDANRSAAPNAPSGVQRPTIIAARPMNPRPAVIPAWNEFVISMLRYAPPSAATPPAATTFR